MSAAVLLQTKQTDAERYAEWRAKRDAQKSSSKDKLAQEFPLIFGKDSKARSTVGKYTNVPVAESTPSKKKPLGQSSTPITKKNDKAPLSTNKKTPGKDGKKGKAVGFGSTLKSSTVVVVNNENKNGNIQANKNNNTNSSNKQLGKKKPSFFNFLGSKSGSSSQQTVVVIEENQNYSSDSNDNYQLNSDSMIELSSFHPALELMNALSMDLEEEQENNKPFISLHQEQLSTEDETTEAVEAPEPSLEALGEKVQDVLDFMLETKEIDNFAHRRLSGQRFSTDVFRRLSQGIPSSGRNSAQQQQQSVVSNNNKPDIAAGIDFHAISCDLAQEDKALMMSFSRDMVIPEFNNEENDGIMIRNQETAVEGLEDGEVREFCPSVMTNPNPSPQVDEEQRNEPVGEAEEEPVANVDCEIGDMDVLYALRNYISTLEEKTFFNNPMYKVKAAKEPQPETEEIVQNEQDSVVVVAATTEGQEAIPAPVETLLSLDEFNATVAYTTALKEEDDDENNLITDLMYAHSNSCTPVNGIAENKVVIYPRQLQLEAVMNKGLLEVSVSSRIRYEHHVKYVVNIEVSKNNWFFLLLYLFFSSSFRLFLAKPPLLP
jgi:hypothetical protein